MKKCIVVMFLFVLLPAVAWAQEPSNAELYQMIKKMERKLDAAIAETNKAKAEVVKAKEETVKVKEELARIKEITAAAPVAVQTASLVRVPETKPGPGVSFEAVYMRPSRSNLDFVIVDSNADTDPQGTLKDIEPDYNRGGRVGLNYDLGSGTDIGVKFTRITSYDTASAVQPSGGRLWGTWLHPDSVIDTDAATSATASYDFEYSVVDLGVGQWVDIGKRFGLRIEAGLRYAEMDQKLKITYIDSPLSRRADITNKNDFSGWGPRVGLGLDWRAGWGFNIFSSVAGSVLVGNVDLALREDDTTGSGTTIPGSIADTIHNRVVPVIETRAGIGYAYRLKNGSSFGAKAGYEWQNWYNMVTAKRFSDDLDDQNMTTDTTDVGLDGFFLEGFINF